MLRPLFDRVVIKELEPDRVRQSGLLVPPGTHDVEVWYAPNSFWIGVALSLATILALIAYKMIRR